VQIGRRTATDGNGGGGRDEFLRFPETRCSLPKKRGKGLSVTGEHWLLSQLSRGKGEAGINSLPQSLCSLPSPNRREGRGGKRGGGYLELNLLPN